jgi:hypothetical protein
MLNVALAKRGDAPCLSSWPEYGSTDEYSNTFPGFGGNRSSKQWHAHRNKSVKCEVFAGAGVYTLHAVMSLLKWCVPPHANAIRMHAHDLASNLSTPPPPGSTSSASATHATALPASPTASYCDQSSPPSAQLDVRQAAAQHSASPCTGPLSTLVGQHQLSRCEPVAVAVAQTGCHAHMRQLPCWQLCGIQARI